MDDTTIDDNMPDVSLLDNDIAQPDATPSEPAEPAAPGADTKEETDKEEPATEGEETPESETQETPPDEEAARRQQNADAAARRVQDRQRVKQAVSSQLDETYGPKSEQDLVDEGMPARDAQIEALRQEMQFERQRSTIAELNASMTIEAATVMSDFPVFNPDSKDFDKEFTAMVEENYRQAARLQTDDRGIILSADVSLYDHYKKMADMFQRGTTRGSQQGQADALTMMAGAEQPGGSSTTGRGDSLQDLEDRLGDIVIT